MSREQRIQQLVQAIPGLSDYQLLLMERISRYFQLPKAYICNPTSSLITKSLKEDFGDVLLIHHAFSKEPFSKDKFEYAFESVLSLHGASAALAPRGTRGFDIVIEGERVSLKTEAAKGIKENQLHISKFMELGGGEWGDLPAHLHGLRDQFLHTLAQLDRILVLRALEKGPINFSYELVEIPKALFQQAAQGIMEMRTESTQYPKPGYCHVYEADTLLYSLYFDGGGERKLQIKNIRKDACIWHATWTFSLEANTPESTQG
jgi:type II restriction enzyme